MNLLDFASILVAAIAAASAYASQRSASRASRQNTITTSRVDLEKEAYIRARAFDVETIKRQDSEINELRKEIIGLRKEVADLRKQLAEYENNKSNI